jgi:hypothetical protein
MPRLRLHLKVLKDPTITTDTAVAAAKSVFALAGVEVDVASTTRLTLPKLENVHVTRSCQPPGPLSDDQRELFDQASGIGPTEIAIFFVQSTIPATNGCAQHPTSLAAVVVTEACTRWTMAHEIGHLLGLSHAATSSQLMFKSTSRIKGDPPGLDASEITAILKNNLVANP